MMAAGNRGSLLLHQRCTPGKENHACQGKESEVSISEAGHVKCTVVPCSSFHKAINNTQDVIVGEKEILI
jgi:hypothetical protein